LPQTSLSFPATSAKEYERLLTEQIKKFRKGVGRKCDKDGNLTGEVQADHRKLRR
jgi:hypothetical protein